MYETTSPNDCVHRNQPVSIWEFHSRPCGTPALSDRTLVAYASAAWSPERKRVKIILCRGRRREVVPAMRRPDRSAHAIRKAAPPALPAASQLSLLIKWRSLSPYQSEKTRASTFFPIFTDWLKLWLNILDKLVIGD